MSLAVMDSASITEYVDSAQSDIEDSPQMGETTTKASILNDFIELLDWEIPTNTELEYSVKAFASTYKVDYALILGGRPVAFVEAKGLDTTLTSTHREQLTAYLQNENVRLGILTNGQEYEFYYRYLGDSNSQFKVEAVEHRLHFTLFLISYRTRGVGYSILLTPRTSQSDDLLRG
jgi:hypothetical protein